MSEQDDWIADVRRWCDGQQRARSADRNGAECRPFDDQALGYEAALPPLQARHWPDAPSAAEADERER